MSETLGYVERDGPSASNERLMMRVPMDNWSQVARNMLVRICDPVEEVREFLGRIVSGPFFPPTSLSGGPGDEAPVAAEDGPFSAFDVFAEIELQGELFQGRPRDTNRRPAPGSPVHPLSNTEVGALLGLSGDMLMGSLSGNDDIFVSLQSKNKSILPRNVGIFGTVGSGKSNSTQVLVEEAAFNGWAVVVLDVEGEYTEMDVPCSEEELLRRLAHYTRSPAGVQDFAVYSPAGCASERPDAQPFTLRLADFETTVIAELLGTSLPERNALLECMEYFEHRARAKVMTNEKESLLGLLDPSPQAKLPFALAGLRERASERAPRSTESTDYAGLSGKLTRLLHSGAFDQHNMRALDPEQLLKPGRVSIFDVSLANDTIKNMATADLLRKVFAYKVAHSEAPPTLLVMEEAHTFISRERVATMNATLQMLRSVSRRGRKRWLALVFVSQQPGHLPQEVFEICNTRLVHNLRSAHNLEALRATAGDVGQDMWAHCPLLGTGEAIMSSPQLARPVVIHVRPSASHRKFVR